MMDDGKIGKQFRMLNDTSSWDEFRDHYLSLKPESSLEVSTSGKYIARMLRDMGFSIHMADPSRLSLIFILQWKMIRRIHTG